MESGEVLLTTSIAEISIEMPDRVLAGDAALSQGGAESVPVKLRHPGRLPQRKPPIGVKPAGQFDLHVPFPLAGRQGQARKGLIVEIQSDAQRLYALLQPCDVNLFILHSSLSPFRWLLLFS